ncbi:CTR1 suppressor protein [Bimuria novae-zelandiae CBS 107.79]|uniref:CTR1 suppressor protein n=1 Tax=Bimuria novae-zelandiae CBS 107.79 TaxID=1447943 RepID=A0A6A5V0M7_9PLEO|nr:CTR1 suppressor protein [Bimuria novae-zelandiae CBS 107.79]
MAPKKKEIGYMNKYVYDAFLWTFSVLVELFFREVHPRGSWKVPKEGPVLFVCAPHANQFVDPLILMRVVKKETDRRIHVLTAEKSMKRKFVGTMAAASGAVPVGRAMDKTKPAPGKIYLPDPINDPCLVRGVDTNFEASDFQIGGSLVLPKVNNVAASAEILAIKGPEEIRLKRPFKGGIAMQQLTGRNDMTEDGTFVDGAAAAIGPAPGYEGTVFKIAPKLNQTEVYDAVHTVLHRGGTIAIFPEGGSHDRTELLPLKAGVAIMSLGTVASKPDCNLKIIPVGMNYLHAHKFRSRAVIEFGNAIEVPVELAERFQAGERREAIAQMLETIREGLISVTVTAPDYDTLMLIQAVRRLYNPKGTKLPLPRVVELNRRLIQGYTKYKDDPRIIDLKKEVLSYNKQIHALRVRDHQVQYARVSVVTCFFLFWYRLLKLAVLSIFVIPGTVLFGAVFIACKLYSNKKAKEALAESNVKVQARDVLATWKLLVAMAVAPLVYTYYVVGITWLYYYNRCFGLLPVGWSKRYLVLAQVIIYPTATYAALRFGEVAMDIFKSLRPLVRMMNPWTANELTVAQARREKLAERITDIINTLGPEMFPDFHSKRVISDPFAQSPPSTPPRQKFIEEAEKEAPQPVESYDFPASPTSPSSDRLGLPKNESYADLANQDIFSTRPSTPKRHHSRRPSDGFGQGFQLKPFSTIGGNLDEVSKRIKSGMRSRGNRRSIKPIKRRNSL